MWDKQGIHLQIFNRKLSTSTTTHRQSLNPIQIDLNIYLIQIDSNRTRFPIKNLQRHSLLVSHAESSNLNTDMCKFQSLRKY